MKIKKILNQLRRDFTAIFECEHCGFEEKRDGYDDAFFHRNVIPSIKCDQCGKTSAQENCIIKTDGNLICPHCLDAVEFTFGVDTLGEPEPSLGHCDHWEMIKASAFITLFLVWVCFAVWGKYVS